MLESLITSKTRLKMLLKFFTNSASDGYLRGLAEEFDESTNSIRHELNNLTTAGYLVYREDGRTIRYSANVDHPLYNEIRNLVHKYLGVEKIIENVLSRLGDLKVAFIVGDYARGADTGTVELLLVGEIDKAYLMKLTDRATGMLKRKIKFKIVSDESFRNDQSIARGGLLVWGNMKEFWG